MRNVFVFVGGFVAIGLLAAACGSASAAPEVVIAAGQPAAVAPEVAETTTTTAAPEEVATEPEPEAEAEVQAVVEADEEAVIPEVSTPEEIVPGGEPEEVAPVARVFEQDEQGRYIIYDESDDDMIFDLFPDLLEVTTILYGDGYVLTSEYKREGFPIVTTRTVWRGSYEELLARGVDPSEIIWVE